MTLHVIHPAREEISLNHPWNSRSGASSASSAQRRRVYVPGACEARLAARRAALVPAAGRSSTRGSGAVRRRPAARGRRPNPAEPSPRPSLWTTVVPYQEHKGTMSARDSLGVAISLENDESPDPRWQIQFVERRAVCDFLWRPRSRIRTHPGDECGTTCKAIAKTGDRLAHPERPLVRGGALASDVVHRPSSLTDREMKSDPGTQRTVSCIAWFRRSCNFCRSAGGVC